MTDLPPLDPDVEATLGDAAAVLGGDEPLAIASHIGPDGDALGSILAVGLAMADTGRHTQIGWGSPELLVPAQYGFLPGLDMLTPPDRFGQPDVALALDCASADRLELLRERFEAARVLVNVDHHVSNTRFGTVDVVDPNCASTAEIVLRLLLRLGADITPEIATCLYTGLVTDTGRFSYASVTPRTHAVAAFLIERGARVEKVSQAVFESLPYGYLKVLGRVLERSRLLADPPLVVSWMSQDDLAEAGIGMDETEEIINVLRSVREADAAAILKELDDGKWKGSVRSKGGTDVSKIALQFGGGGHRLAAGFTSEFGLEETIDRIHEILSASGERNQA